MRRRRRAGSGPLNERQAFALYWLNAQPEDGAYAWKLGDAMRAAGLISDEQSRRYRDRVTGCSISAARTLSSLRLRGLASSSTPGGEAFQSVRWYPTELGRELEGKVIS